MTMINPTIPYSQHFRCSTQLFGNAVLSNVFMYLFDEYLLAVRQGKSVLIPYSVRTIASAVGISNSSVSPNLKKLEQLNVANFGDGKCVINFKYYYGVCCLYCEQKTQDGKVCVQKAFQSADKRELLNMGLNEGWDAYDEVEKLVGSPLSGVQQEVYQNQYSEPQGVLKSVQQCTDIDTPMEASVLKSVQQVYQNQYSEFSAAIESQINEFIGAVSSNYSDSKQLTEVLLPFCGSIDEQKKAVEFVEMFSVYQNQYSGCTENSTPQIEGVLKSVQLCLDILKNMLISAKNGCTDFSTGVYQNQYRGVLNSVHRNKYNNKKTKEEPPSLAWGKESQKIENKTEDKVEDENSQVHLKKFFQGFEDFDDDSSDVDFSVDKPQEEAAPLSSREARLERMKARKEGRAPKPSVEIIELNEPGSQPVVSSREPSLPLPKKRAWTYPMFPSDEVARITSDLEYAATNPVKLFVNFVWWSLYDYFQPEEELDEDGEWDDEAREFKLEGNCFPYKEFNREILRPAYEEVEACMEKGCVETDDGKEIPITFDEMFQPEDVIKIFRWEIQALSHSESVYVISKRDIFDVSAERIELASHPTTREEKRQVRKEAHIYMTKLLLITATDNPLKEQLTPFELVIADFIRNCMKTEYEGNDYLRFSADMDKPDVTDEGMLTRPAYQRLKGDLFQAGFKESDFLSCLPFGNKPDEYGQLRLMPGMFIADGIRAVNAVYGLKSIVDDLDIASLRKGPGEAFYVAVEEADGI